MEKGSQSFLFCSALWKFFSVVAPNADCSLKWKIGGILPIFRVFCLLWTFKKNVTVVYSLRLFKLLRQLNVLKNVWEGQWTLRGWETGWIKMVGNLLRFVFVSYTFSEKAILPRILIDLDSLHLETRSYFTFASHLHRIKISSIKVKYVLLYLCLSAPLPPDHYILQTFASTVSLFTCSEIVRLENFPSLTLFLHPPTLLKALQWYTPGVLTGSRKSTTKLKGSIYCRPHPLSLFCPGKRFFNSRQVTNHTFSRKKTLQEIWLIFYPGN